MINNYSNNLKKSSLAPYQYVLFNESPDNLIQGTETFTVQEYNYKVSNQNLTFSVYMYGINTSSMYLKQLFLSNNKIILSSSLSKKLHLKTNDKITLYLPSSNTKKEFTINEIWDYPTFAIFTSLDNFNLIHNKPLNYYNGIFSQEKLNINESNLVFKISSSDYNKIGDQMLSTFGSFTPFCFVISIIFHLIIMFILTKIVIDKNKKNISLLKILGYEPKIINKVYITPTTIVVVISSFLSIPFVYLFMKLIINLIFSKISGYMETYIPIWVTAIFVGFTIITYLVINILNLDKIKKLSSGLILKSLE
jgi:putative ABC transport system permease protein